MTSWRLALRLGWRDSIRHRGRTALVVAMIALPLIAGTGMFTLVRSFESTPQAQAYSELGPSAGARVEESGCSRLAQSPDGSSWECEGEDSGTTITEAALREVLPGGEFVPVMAMRVDLVSDSAAVPDQQVVEVGDPPRADSFVDVTSGRLPNDPSEMALSGSLARRLGVGLGDSITIDAGTSQPAVTIVGILDPRTRNYPAIVPSGTTGVEWSPTAWLVVGDDPVTWEQVQEANERSWFVTSRSTIVNPPAQEAQSGSGEDNVALIALVGAVIAMGLMEMALLVGPAFAIGASRNARQLALIAASGGSRAISGASCSPAARWREPSRPVPASASASCSAQRSRSA